MKKIIIITLLFHLSFLYSGKKRKLKNKIMGEWVNYSFGGIQKLSFNIDGTYIYYDAPYSDSLDCRTIEILMI